MLVRYGLARACDPPALAMLWRASLRLSPLSYTENAHSSASFFPVSALAPGPLPAFPSCSYSVSHAHP
eukprot:4349241-Pleurochrysis_carterae.AAC.1